jgi:flagellar protein FliS
MNYTTRPTSGLEQYKSVNTQVGLSSASPHRLIQMLLEGALEKINFAKGHLQRGETALKGSNISWAISIIEGLRMSLDRESGNELSRNLDDLYDYMVRRLMEANAQNSLEMLDEVSGLLLEIKSAWDAVPELLQEQTNAPHPA